MAQKATTIEINGRLYDATTGKQVTAATTVAAPKTVPAGRAIDGFHAPVANRRPRQPSPDSAKVHRTTERSQKLHAAAVKQQSAITAKSHAAPTTVAPPQNNAQPSQETSQRQARAAQHKRSDKISRFGIRTVAQHMAEEPKKPDTDVFVPAPFKATQAAPAQTQPAPQPVVAPRVQDEPVEAQAKPSFKDRVKELSGKRPKLIPATSAVLAVLLVGAYVTYINLPNMALRVAASRAGFSASLPGYKPSGFSFRGPIAYAPGNITIKYDSNSDTRNFQIVQRESQWDSHSLLDNFLVKEGKEYLTFQERGLTVYVFDQDQATWVDGGIWYTIESQANLNNEQLLKIAGSL